jgi:hypothetical protein
MVSFGSLPYLPDQEQPKQETQPTPRQGHEAGLSFVLRCWTFVLIAANGRSTFIRSMIVQGLVLSARNSSDRFRNRLHTKAMKPVFHSSFDVGRSMLDVRFDCGHRPLQAFRG